MPLKALERAWEGAKTVQNWRDPWDVLAAGAANTIEAIVPTTNEELFIDLVGMSRGGPLKYYGTKVGRKAFKALTDLRVRGLDDTAGLTPALADGAEFGIKYSTPPVKPSTLPVKPSNPLAISKTTTTAAKVINTSIDTSKEAVKEQARVVAVMRNNRNVARDVIGNPNPAINANRNLQAAMQGQYEELYGLPGKAIVDRMNKIWSGVRTTLSPRGVGARTHHVGVLGDIDTGWKRIPQNQQLEVQYILHDKYNRLLGHNLENLITLFSEPAHKYIGHAGGTINKPLRAAFRKFPFETASPEQTADFLEKHLRHLTAKSMNALYSKQNVDAGLAVLNAIPAKLRRQLPTNFNPLSLDPNEPGRAVFNKLASALPKEAQVKLRLAMMKQGAVLESLKLAEKIAK